jgi:hypothetical protein
MNTTGKLVAVAVLVMGLCGPVHAAWVFNVDPKDVRASIASGQSMVTFSTVQSLSNPANCGAVDFYAVPFDINGHHKSVLSILLTAVASQRKVAVYVSDTQCSLGRPIALDVMIS